MSSLTGPVSGAIVDNVLARVKISEVYRTLTGKQPKKAGADTWRATAVWRGGDGPNVSLNDTRNVWLDFVSNEGGGVLDLIVLICGGSRQDAFHWLADFAGVRLEERPLTPEERADWAEQQRQIKRELPRARLWQRAAIALGEEVLDTFKAALSNPKLPRPGIGEIAFWTTQLSKWHRLAGPGLVGEYRWWANHHPRLTAGLIYAASLQEQAENRALEKYVRVLDLGARI
jgi:hypothetical protein